MQQALINAHNRIKELEAERDALAAWIVKHHGGEALLPKEQARCADCDDCARLAYSGATTPGFFYDRCELHRTKEQAK